MYFRKSHVCANKFDVRDTGRRRDGRLAKDLGERGRMDSPMVSQSTAGRISESTTINENDVRLMYLLEESST